MTAHDSGFDLPGDLEAEQQLLGAILVNNEAYERVRAILTPEMFVEPVHGRIFAAIGEAIKAGLSASPSTLKAIFSRDPALDGVGGADYLGRLQYSTASVIIAVDYAKIIREHFLRRSLAELGEKMIGQSLNPIGFDRSRMIIAEAEQRLFELGASVAEQRSVVGMDRVASDTFEIIKAAKANPGGVTGVPSGIKGWDRLTGGFVPGEYYIIGGRPSMGKTALGLCVARNISRHGKGVVFVSLEMTREALGLRLASLIGYSTTTTIPYSEARRGTFTSWQWDRFEEALEDSRTLPLLIDDQPGRSIPAIRLTVRRAVEQWHKADIQPGAVIIDYLQLISASDRYKSQRVNEVDEISKGLKEIAKEFSVPILALSQLNRSVEQRDDKRPVMSDLRDSGALEQDADAIFFCYREYYYAKDKKNVDAEWLTSIENKATIIIAKQRNGPTRDIDLFFDAPHGLWGDM